MVKFRALQSAIVSDSKVPKHQSTADFGALDDALVQKILEVLRHKPEISQGEMAEELGTTRRVIQKKMILLKEAGRIKRIGGKRYGHWEPHEKNPLNGVSGVETMGLWNYSRRVKSRGDRKTCATPYN